MAVFDLLEFCLIEIAESKLDDYMKEILMSFLCQEWDTFTRIDVSLTTLLNILNKEYGSN